MQEAIMRKSFPLTSDEKKGAMRQLRTFYYGKNRVDDFKNDLKFET